MKRLRLQNDAKDATITGTMARTHIKTLFRNESTEAVGEPLEARGGIRGPMSTRDEGSAATAAVVAAGRKALL